MSLEGSYTASSSCKLLELPRGWKYPLVLLGARIQVFTCSHVLFSHSTGHFQIGFLLNKAVSALYSDGLLPRAFLPRDDLAEKFLRTGHSWCFVIACPDCTLCLSNVVAQFEHLVKTFKNHSVTILQTRNSCAGERASWLLTTFSEVWWEAQCSRIPGGEWQN